MFSPLSFSPFLSCSLTHKPLSSMQLYGVWGTRGVDLQIEQFLELSNVRQILLEFSLVLCFLEL